MTRIVPEDADGIRVAIEKMDPRLARYAIEDALSQLTRYTDDDVVRIAIGIYCYERAARRMRWGEDDMTAEEVEVTVAGAIRKQLAMVDADEVASLTDDPYELTPTLCALHSVGWALRSLLTNGTRSFAEVEVEVAQKCYQYLRVSVMLDADRLGIPEPLSVEQRAALLAAGYTEKDLVPLTPNDWMERERERQADYLAYLIKKTERAAA